MTTPVNKELAILMKEKGFDLPTLHWYHKDNKKFNTNDLMFSMNKLTDNYSAPTIAEVVTWLYEKHGIWVSVVQNEYDDKFQYTLTQRNPNCWYVVDNGKQFDSPTEAYMTAFEYTLNKLI